MFENFRVFETELAGRPLVVETGKMAQLANGECLVRYGDTSGAMWRSPRPPSPGTASISSPCRWTLRKSFILWAKSPAPS